MADRTTYLVPDLEGGVVLSLTAAAADDRVQYQKGAFLIVQNTGIAVRTVTITVWSQVGNVQTEDYTVAGPSIVLIGLKHTGATEGHMIPVTYDVITDLVIGLIKWEQQ